MAKLKPQHATDKAVFAGFCGIRPNADRPDGSAAEVLNFRIRPDGSLEKRNGWEAKRFYNGTVKAMWEGVLGEAAHLFTVSGSSIFRSTGEHSSKIVGAVSPDDKVSFLKYRDTLFLIDGTKIQVYRPSTDSFEAVEAYAPLYGYQWDPQMGGNVCEPINLLTKRLRVNYLNTAANVTFTLPYFAKAIDCVRVDNKTVTEYSLNTMGDQLTIPGSASASVVEVAYTMEFEYEITESLLQSTLAHVTRQGDSETLYLSGSSKGYRVFCSTTITEPMFTYCSVFYPTVDPLYFRASSLINLGHADDPPRAFCKHYDRTLIFSESGAWAVQVNPKTDLPEYESVLTQMGCNRAGAAVSYGNDLFLLNVNGFYRLHATVSDKNTFQIEKLTLPDSARFLPSQLRDAILFFDPYRNEFWIRDPADTAGTVLIYNATAREWVFFDHVPARFFFWKDSSIGFAYDSNLCIFSKEQHKDTGSTFTASYKSKYLHLGDAATVKRAARVTLCGNPNSNATALKIQTEGDVETIGLIGEDGADAPECFDRRLTVGRFRHICFSISVLGNAPASFDTLTLLAKA